MSRPSINGMALAMRITRGVCYPLEITDIIDEQSHPILPSACITAVAASHNLCTMLWGTIPGQMLEQQGALRWMGRLLGAAIAQPRAPKCPPWPPPPAEQGPGSALTNIEPFSYHHTVLLKLGITSCNVSTTARFWCCEAWCCCC